MSQVSQEIWIYAEHIDGRIQEITFELLGKGYDLSRKCGATTAAVLLCDSGGSMAKELISHGAQKVYLKEDSLFKTYHCIPHVQILCNLVRAYRPMAFLFGATSLGGHLAARVAAGTGTGLSAHCIDLDVNEQGNILHRVPGFGGNVLATIVCPNHRPQMATIKPGVFKRAQPGYEGGTLIGIEMDLQEEQVWPKVLQIHREKPRGSDLKEAKVVIAGGWGVSKKENWTLLEELASLLNGAVGATRPAVDEGWADEKDMIGQSGITVRPDLYIGVGVSGSMHHMVGIQDSKMILSINKDPRAPILEMSDLGIVADLEEALPILIEKIKRRLARE